MNKNVINQEIKVAYDALKESAIADSNNTIVKTFRGQISTFGAAVSMGSLLPAIAFFSEKGGSDVDRTKLLDAIIKILQNTNKTKEKNLYDYVLNNPEDECKEEILNAAIALKLSMNLYKLV